MLWIFDARSNLLPYRTGRPFSIFVSTVTEIAMVAIPSNFCLENFYGLVRRVVYFTDPSGDYRHGSPHRLKNQREQELGHTDADEVVADSTLGLVIL